MTRIVMLFALGATLVCPSAFGALTPTLYPVAGDTVHFVGDPVWNQTSLEDGQPLQGLFPGGEFEFTVQHSGAPAATGAFTTFCSEITQNIWQGAIDYTYRVAAVTNVDSSGPSMQPEAAWLYHFYKYGNGTIVPNRLNVLSNPWNATSAATLQWALWHYMGYSNTTIYNETHWSTSDVPASGGNQQEQYQNTVDGWLTGSGYSEASANALGNEVQIAQLKLLDSNGSDYCDAQDQYIIVSPSGQSVPEPVSLAIWAIAGGLGAAGLGLKRRWQGRWSEQTRQAIMEVIER